MNYILIILTVVCALLAELFGLTKPNKNWSNFPKNLTIAGSIFLLATLLFGLLSIIVTVKSDRENNNAKSELRKTIINQNIKIDSLKSELGKFNENIIKLQHPIPNEFTVWITLEFNIDEISADEQKEKFDLFESFFLFLMLHKDLEPKSFSNGEMPINIELRTEELKTNELIKNDKITVNRTKNGIDVNIKSAPLRIVDNATEFTSITDMCSKFAEIRVLIPNVDDKQLEYFKIKRLNIKTPNGNQLRLKDIDIENGLALKQLDKNCWH